MGALLQNPVVLMCIAAILIFLATSLLGVWELRLPYLLTRAASKSYSGYFGSLFIGWILVGMATYFIQPLLSSSTRIFPMAAVALGGGICELLIIYHPADF
jgi:thiol:disulfide interchange protein DsbD